MQLKEVENSLHTTLQRNTSGQQKWNTVHRLCNAFGKSIQSNVLYTVTHKHIIIRTKRAHSLRETEKEAVPTGNIFQDTRINTRNNLPQVAAE